MVQAGRLGADEALTAAKQIGNINPNFMNTEIIKKFESELSDISNGITKQE